MQWVPCLVFFQYCACPNATDHELRITSGDACADDVTYNHGGADVATCFSFSSFGNGTRFFANKMRANFSLGLIITDNRPAALPNYRFRWPFGPKPAFRTVSSLWGPSWPQLPWRWCMRLGTWNDVENYWEYDQYVLRAISSTKLHLWLMLERTMVLVGS